MEEYTSLITELKIEREDSDVSLPPELGEADDMATDIELPSTVTFSRLGTNLPNDEDIRRRDEQRHQDVASRTASRNLSRVSFKPPSRLLKRNKSRIAQTPAELNFDEEYEWDSDEEMLPVRYSSAAEQHKNTYKQKCRQLGIIPSRKVMNQFGTGIVDITDLNLSSKELRALYIVMINDVDLMEINFSGNSLTSRDIQYISEILRTNKTISTLTLRRCGLSGAPIRTLAEFLSKSNTLRKLDISDNHFDDKDAPHVAMIIEHNESISNLDLSRNKLGDSGILIGNALKDNEMITTLDLSWNHLRGNGAIGIARGLEKNSKLLNLQVSWNGFGFEGCAALGHTLVHNSTLSTIDLANNRIHNPAMFELLKGICGNKSLSTIRLAQNPITAPMTSIILQRISSSKECGLKELDMEGIVVDKEFDPLLENIQDERLFMARYDISLPVRKGVVSNIDSKNVFNIDPIRILYFMKEHMRTIDMFLKFDKDNSNSLSREELHFAFEREGYPISTSALDTVMGYLDTNRDGDVDLIRTKIESERKRIENIISKKRSGELIDGERRLKRHLIAEAQEARQHSSKLAPSPSEKREYSKTYLKPSEALLIKQNSDLVSPRRIDIKSPRRSDMKSSGKLPQINVHTN
ncbi:leucine-rich repeat-containing protein 74A-like isoform X2 [Mytilus trossulus]|uniref:leucine-rich repeat-containing protein 74A-like isoform X2 n=1 Tax=Mytilus trossulus TaxID=6551 RepID=UPI003005E254